ncbi:unnamed protein product [Penicillium olsonii]|nr:unnamed protein product [Penicillium olsonii]
MSHPPDIWWVKLSDFGLSKRIEEASGASTLLKGTPGYIAPELYELTERGSPYAPDIWAVGATLFFMLVKRPAFDSLGRLAKYATDIEGFPSGLLADVGATHLCIEFIESLMGVRPKDRAPADVAIHHKWLKEMNTPPPSRAGSGFPLDSPPSPKALSTGLSTEEFAPWDTVSSRQTSNDTLKHGPHEGTREDFNIPIQRDSIKLSGGKIRVAKELFHRGCEGEAVFSADSTVLAVAGSKNPLRLWDMSSYSEIPGLKARLCIAFSPDGKLFASCGLFNYLQLWDAPTRTALESHNLTGYPQSVIFSPDSKMVACAVNDTVFFRHVAEGSNLRKFKFHIALESRPLPIHLAFSSDSKSIWLARADKFQKLEIDQDTPKHCFRLPVGGDALGISADGQYIAYLDPARTRNICLMELSTRRMVLEIKSKFIHSRVAFSHKAKLFAVYESGRSYNRGILSLWDLDAKEELSATTCRSSVQSIAFSPDDTMIASTSRYGSTLLWVADTRSE